MGNKKMPYLCGLWRFANAYKLNLLERKEYNIMRELKSYIFRNYGYKLTDEELELLINWYASNEYKLDEDNLNDEVLGFLVKTFPDKDVVLLEDDSSNITYLLALLKKATEK